MQARNAPPLIRFLHPSGLHFYGHTPKKHCRVSRVWRSLFFCFLGLSEWPFGQGRHFLPEMHRARLETQDRHLITFPWPASKDPDIWKFVLGNLGMSTCQNMNLEGSFSVVSKPMFASNDSLYSIFLRSTRFTRFCNAPNSKSSQILTMCSPFLK